MIRPVPEPVAAPADGTLVAPLVAALVLVDPVGLGGVCLRAPAGEARDRWLSSLRALLPEGTPLRRVPLNISDAALLGGLDLGATLQSGRRRVQQGLLAQADGGLVLLAMAERLSGGAAARLTSALDLQEVVMERDGMATRSPARLGMLALDEGLSDDEGLAPALKDRLAFHLTAQNLADADDGLPFSPSDIVQARQRLGRVSLSDDILQALCATAMALGVDSLRAPQLALRAARAAAALAGLDAVSTEHARLAAQLVLAHRATRLPASAADEVENEDSEADAMAQPPAEPPPAEPGHAEQPPPTQSPADDRQDDRGDDTERAADGELADTVLEAAQAAIPAGLLAALKIGLAARGRAQSTGRVGAVLKSQTRGRPIGALRSEPRQGQRLSLIDTLRAAAPWQRLRASAAVAAPAAPNPQRLRVLKEDFHVMRFRQQRQTTTLFVVDASGSAALHRLAEAKGAVELLLAECYVRRDQVALLAFRGKSAELLLPPTRSLARAKRSLAALAGGGGTPLASGLIAAHELALQVIRRGETPVMVLLTDGRANISRNGQAGRPQALDDALAAARQIRSAGIAALLLDTSAQAQPGAQAVAQAMGGAYLPLPHAGARDLSRAVQWASGHPGQH